jgi:hypothetical protein
MARRAVLVSVVVLLQAQPVLQVRGASHTPASSMKPWSQWRLDHAIIPFSDTCPTRAPFADHPGSRCQFGVSRPARRVPSLGTTLVHVRACVR